MTNKAVNPTTPLSEDEWEAFVERLLVGIDRRLARTETKMSQMMLHVGMDPHVQMYDNTPNDKAVKLLGK